MSEIRIIDPDLSNIFMNKFLMESSVRLMYNFIVALM
jgi:hypothetical protein